MPKLWLLEAPVAAGSSMVTTGALLLAGLALPAFWLWRQSTDEPLPMPAALRSAGVWADGRLRLRTVLGKGTGLFVDAPVAAGDVLMVVPAGALLSGSMAKRVLGEVATEVEPRVALCALLAEARREAEKGNDTLGLMEYLLRLPRHYPSLPLCMTDEEASAQLSGTALLTARQELREGVESDRCTAEAKLGGFLEALWDARRWRWAQGTILTRAGDNVRSAAAASSHGDDEAEGPESDDRVIVPLVDFANCETDPSAECQQDAGGGVRLLARKALRKNAEVTLFYGPQSQEQLLFTFGFVLPGAPIAVSAPLPLVVTVPETPSNEEKGTLELRGKLLQLLALEREVEGGWPRLSKKPNGDIDTSELWAAMNIHTMDKDALWQVRNEVARTGMLPATLGQRLAGPVAATKMKDLLDAWLQALGQGEARPRRPSPAQEYRQSCRDIVEATREALDEEAALEPTLIGRA